MNNSVLVIVGLCALAAALLAAVLALLRALIAAKTKLELEVIRRADQETLNAARQHALDAQRISLKNEFGEECVIHENTISIKGKSYCIVPAFKKCVFDSITDFEIVLALPVLLGKLFV